MVPAFYPGTKNAICIAGSLRLNLNVLKAIHRMREGELLWKAMGGSV